MSSSQQEGKVQRDLAALRLAADETVAPNTAPGSLGEPTTVSSLSYRISSTNASPLFRYDVQVCEEREQNNEFVVAPLRTGGNNDHVVQVSKTLAYLILGSLAEGEQRAYFGSMEDLTFDQRKILYSFRKLQMDASGKKSFDVPMAKLLAYVGQVFSGFTEKAIRETFLIRPNVIGFKFQIQPADGSDGLFEISLMNMNAVPDANSNNEYDRSLLQYLELLTSQHLIYSMSFSIFDNNSVFHKNAREPLKLPGSRSAWAEVAAGVHKSVAAVAGQTGDKQPPGRQIVLHLDVKRTAMLQQQTVAALIEAKFDQRAAPDRQRREKVSALLKGVAVKYQMPNGGYVQFEASKLSAKSAAEQTFTKDGVEISVADYFRKQYNKKLSHPNLPCVMPAVRAGGRHEYYPAELCVILPHQRIGGQKDSAIVAELIKRCSITPDRRRQEADAFIRDSGLFDNAFLRRAGIRIERQPIECAARVLPRPDVLYSGVKPTTIGDDGSWRRDRAARFLRGARLDSWRVLVVGGYGGALPMAKEDYDLFLNSYLKLCSAVGMKNVQKPGKIQQVEDTDTSISSQVRRAAAERCRFVLLIAADESDERTHGILKLTEQQTGVVTQQVNEGTVRRCIGQNKQGRPDMNVMENIVAKTNLKLGGLNYSLADVAARINVSARERELFANEHVLYVGIDASHADPLKASQRRRNQQQTQPTVIGFCSNAGASPHDFVGGYSFQAPLQQLQDGVALKAHINQALRAWLKANGRAPDQLRVYREGVSAGQYNQVLRTEVQDIRACLQQLAPACRLVYIVCRHDGVRLMPEIKRLAELTNSGRRQPPHLLNVQPGTVEDKCLVSDRYLEFKLCSHKTIQGTASIPVYTVLVNDAKLTKDALEYTTYRLCFGHAIIKSAVSKPAVLYAAKNLAKRGKMNMITYARTEAGSLSGRSGDSEDHLFEGISIEQLNKALQVDDNNLINQMYWA